jgi:hypothetical protein
MKQMKHKQKLISTDPFSHILSNGNISHLQQYWIILPKKENYQAIHIKYLKKKSPKPGKISHFIWQMPDKRLLCFKLTANAAPGLPPPQQN